MRKTLIASLVSSSLLLSLTAHATDLEQIYQQAAKNDATYQAAFATYQAAAEGIPIARGGLLPSLVLTGNSTWNDNLNTPSYNSNGYSLTLSQPLLNLAAWSTYSQADLKVKIAALVLASAEQTLLTSVATDYFAVLQDQDNLSYAKAFQDQQQENMSQAEQKYHVGLAAMSDVQYARAQYESAVAQTVSAQNAVENAFENLSVLTGQPEKDLAPLKADFSLFKPQPESPDAWVQAGLQHNIALQQANLQVEADKWGIRIQQAGFAPTVNAVGTTAYTSSNINNTGTTYPKSASLQLNYNLFTGGTTLANVQVARYTEASDAATAENTRRQTISQVRQAYLNVLSDISQIVAYKQAIISGQTSLAAARAAYQVGTETLVDLLTQESNLLQSQQSYASAINSYINDSLNLKLQAGTLTASDLSMINQTILQTASTPAAPATKLTPNKPAPATIASTATSKE